MSDYSGGTKMYCPTCKRLRTCVAVPPAMFGEEPGQRRSLGGVHYFLRMRSCQACSQQWLTAEIAEDLVKELLDLRHTLAQYSAGSKPAGTSADTSAVAKVVSPSTLDRDKKRFLGKVAKEAGAGCWIWTGGKTKSGVQDSSVKPYGQFWFERVVQSAHRASYKLFVGPIPDGMNVMHTCSVPDCVNPKHLKLAYQAEIISEKIRKNRHWKKETKKEK